MCSHLGSVMHYPKDAFAIDYSIDVITPLIGKPNIGQRTGFSDVITYFCFIIGLFLNCEMALMLYYNVIDVFCCMLTTTVGRAESQQVIQLL